nr:AAA family ATPase [uncultured Brevundimonas sp.]
MASIKRIRSMTGVGVFADIRAAAPSPDFNKCTLIYGHNGSGKTTLSRLFTSLEKGVRDSRLPSGSGFEVELDDGTLLGTASNLTGLEGRLAVFNADYASSNLQWTDRTASPIYYIGADQAEAAAKIRELEAALPERRTALQAATKAAADADKLLGTHKRDRAKLIASHLHAGTRKYEANHLANDYDANLHIGVEVLTDVQLASLEAVLRLDAPTPKVTIGEFSFADLAEIIWRSTELASKSIGGVMLDEIDRHPEMLQWVKAGHEYHAEHNLDECLYCAGAITKERSDALSRALDDKVSDFIADIEASSASLLEAAAALRTARADTPVPTMITAGLQGEYRSIIDEAKTTFPVLDKLIADAQERVKAKLAAPTRAVDFDAIQFKADLSETLKVAERIVERLGDVIRRHNEAFDSFAAEQARAYNKVKGHFLADGVTDYARFIDERDHRRREEGAAQTLHDDVTRQLGELRQQVREHGAAAEKINRLITSYLGHSELQVHAVDEGYELWRHGRLMDGHPSEGEKTAIALCYFLSSLEAEGRDVRRMVVVVDDPMSSLDTGALNFCCNLMKSRLGKAQQLIVLTHNHHCMNEFKKGWRKLAENTPPTGALLYLNVSKPADAARRSSRLVAMPGHLYAYDSEYVFLYEKMLRFNEQGDASEYFHMMPNVLRKVLEIFLAFKVPGSDNLLQKIGQIRESDFELDRDRLVALERLSQVESHSDSIDDLIGFSSMTIEETKSATASLLDLIQKLDDFHARKMARLCRVKA